MKALIVDSDLAARGTLRRALDSMKDVEVVKECATIDDAITAAGPSAPELWIIESWLPGCGACYLAGSLDLESYLVNELQKGSNGDAYRALSMKTICLSRPVDRIRLTEAVDLLHYLEDRSGEETSEPMYDSEPLYEEASRALTRRSSNHDTLMVHSEEGVYVFMKPSQIRWIDAAGRCTRLYLQGRIVHCQDSLSCLLAKLSPDTFVRIHRSIVVNKDHVQDVLPSDSGGVEIVMTGGKGLRVSRSSMDAVKKLVQGSSKSSRNNHG